MKKRGVLVFLPLNLIKVSCSPCDNEAYVRDWMWYFRLNRMRIWSTLRMRQPLRWSPLLREPEVKLNCFSVPGTVYIKNSICIRDRPCRWGWVREIYSKAFNTHLHQKLCLHGHQWLPKWWAGFCCMFERIWHSIITVRSLKISALEGLRRNPRKIMDKSFTLITELQLTHIKFSRVQFCRSSIFSTFNVLLL